ncbi:MAG: phosphoenolpyruvate--protein phosphotransferase [Candidatus Hodarchaeales archaeon]|jgi:phosphotransferase system enzyme I (PtsI)
MQTIEGIPASSGIAIGKVFLYEKNTEYDQLLEKLNHISVEEAQEKFLRGIEIAIEYLESIKKKTESEVGLEEAGIFDAQILILEDEDFQTAVVNELVKGTKLLDAIWGVIDYYVGKFKLMENSYFQERATDIRDVGNQLLNALIGKKTCILSELSERVIIVAKELSPSETAEMRKEMVAGFATDLGGSASHVAIIARALNIPAVVGSSKVTSSVEQGDILILDGVKGNIIINPPRDMLDSYDSMRKQLLAEQLELKKFAHVKVATSDGKKISILANIGAMEDIETALENGAEGVGLLRTEFLYIQKRILPEEEDLFRIFRKILVNMGDKPVILRTLDMGGDKEIPGLHKQKETNPFLGLRGSRFISDIKLRNIILVQIRAALKASVYGKLKIMFPMVSTVSEIIELSSMVDECKLQVEREGFTVLDSLEVGVMVEVPSIALCVEAFAPYVDFFSIGTNDLTQYVLASDRTNETVASIYDQYHPAIFNLIEKVVIGAHNHGKWVGVCGELASEELAVPILVGLGVDELSMNSTKIPSVKKKITELSLSKCEKLAKSVLSMASGNEVRELVEKRKLN